MIRSTIRALVLAGGLCTLSACIFDSPELANEAPPLAGMREPLALLTEPADELERAALDPGSFSGLEVADARASLDALLEAPEGLAVAQVVENSPAAQAGMVPGDVLLSARTLPDGTERTLAWPSEWRELELNTEPGREIEVSLDRAGITKKARILLVQRYRPAERLAVARLREDLRAGIVVRGATEVEARKAGLGPGGGAVIVGLSSDSPWRKADLRFEDLIVTVDGERVVAPEVLVGRIKSAKQGERLELEVLRGTQSLRIQAPLSEREHDFNEVSIPLLFSYEHSRNSSDTSLLFGSIRFERTSAAWKLRILWLFKFAGGDSDRLEELGS